MPATEALRVIQLSLHTLDLLNDIGVEITEVTALYQRLRAENRDFTLAEIAAARIKAREALDAARKVE